MDTTTQNQKDATGIIIMVAVAVILVGMLWGLVSSNPGVYRFVFGHRWSTAVVRTGDQLDLGNGKFRLLVGKEMNYRTLFPGDVVCLKADKPYIQILADQWGQKIPQPHLAGARTLLGETNPVGVTLEGKIPDTIIQLTEGWCPSKR